MQSGENPPLITPRDGINVEGQLRPHEFFLVRFVPDIVRGEFINIGLVLREFREPADSSQAPSRVCIAPDYKRLLGLFHEADVHYLYQAQKLIEKSLGDIAGDGVAKVPSFDKLLAQWSLTIQVTDPQGCLADDIDTEFMLLMRMYVDSSYGIDHKSQKLPLHALLQSTLPEVGFSVPPGLYTEVGDTLEFDYAYMTATTSHLIHAICISEGIEPALALAQRVPSLRERAMKAEGKLLEITVVTEAPPEQSTEFSDASAIYDFAVASMRKAGITVKTVADVPMIAADIELLSTSE